MVIPKIKRVNTIGIRYVNGEVKEEHYVKIIKDTLGIQDDEIFGLGDWSKKRFVVKVKTSTRYAYIVENFVGQEIVLDENNTILIDDVSSYKNRVVVKYVPWEFDNNVLKNILGRYGRVENIINCTWKSGDYKGVLNGEKIVWMVVEEPIPSSLFINETQSYFHFRYDTQTPTCLKCGSLDHKAYQCEIAKTLKPDKRHNAVNLGLDEFPDTLNGHRNPVGESSDSVRGSDDPVDETSDPTQVANDPVDGNTDSEDSRSSLSSDSDSPQSPTPNSNENAEDVEQAVECEILFTCLECEYRSKNKMNYDIHIASHLVRKEKIRVKLILIR